MKLKKTLRALFVPDVWRPTRSNWPWPEGYAVQNKRRNLVLEVGLTKGEAQARCQQLNADKDPNNLWI
jgi:hypothetical protein